MAHVNNSDADFGAGFIGNVLTSFYLFALSILVFTCLVTNEILIGLGFAASGLAFLFFTKLIFADLKKLFTTD